MSKEHCSYKLYANAYFCTYPITYKILDTRNFTVHFRCDRHIGVVKGYNELMESNRYTCIPIEENVNGK